MICKDSYNEITGTMNTTSMTTDENYIDEVKAIKQAIIESQSRAIRMVSGEQLSLYFGVGLYVSEHSREGYWGSGAIEKISARLQKEMPGLRGFSAESIKKMRTFSEFWSKYLTVAAGLDANRSAATTDLQNESCPISCDMLSLQKWSAATTEINRDDFLGISFSHHMEILHKTRDINEVLYYIRQTRLRGWSSRKLREMIAYDVFGKEGASMPSNFAVTMPETRNALNAVRMFKDQYLLDFINVEDVGKEYEDVDERVVEKEIVRNIKKFIMTFGHDFAFVGNQYHLEAFGEEQFPDLLFFNRELNALVVVELKMGKFKSAYLGQLFGYLQILDDQVRKPHENPSIGIVLCKEANKAYAEYAVRDYNKPMGVATYKTLDDLPEQFRHALPAPEDLRKLLSENDV